METKEILKKLCTECGISGREKEMLDIVRELLEDTGAEISLLPTGTVLARMGNKNAGYHIMLDAHMDRIGLIVTYIDEKGFLAASPVGGVDLRALAGSAVVVRGKEDITGVVCTLPPHLSKDSGLTRDNIHIDTGLDPEEVKKLVSPGDSVIVMSKFREMAGNAVAVSALDNRAGCAVLIRCAELLCDLPEDIRVTLVFSSQEETNESGARTAAYELLPDEAVVVDVGFAKQDGVPAGVSGKMGGGPIITISPVLSRAVTKGLEEAAAGLGIPVDHEVSGGRSGTNADGISVTGRGIPCGLISVPEKNMHTQAEMVCVEDIDRTAEIIAAYIRKKGEPVNG